MVGNHWNVAHTYIIFIEKIKNRFVKRMLRITINLYLGLNIFKIASINGILSFERYSLFKSNISAYSAVLVQVFISR